MPAGGQAKRRVCRAGLPPPRILRYAQNDSKTSRLRPRLLHRAAGGLRHRDRAVAVLHAVLSQDLEPFPLPGAGDAEDGDLLRRVVAGFDDALHYAAGDDVHTGVGDDVHDDGDLLDAGLAEDELGERCGLGRAGVAADLAIVGGPAAVLADGVEDGERAAAGADDQPQVPFELDDAAGDAAVVLGVDLRAPDLELGGRARLAGLLAADAELLEDGGLAVAGLLLHVDVAVEGDEGAILKLAEGVYLG